MIIIIVTAVETSNLSCLIVTSNEYWPSMEFWILGKRIVACCLKAGIVESDRKDFPDKTSITRQRLGKLCLKAGIFKSIAWATQNGSTLPLQRIVSDKINVLPRNESTSPWRRILSTVMSPKQRNCCNGIYNHERRYSVSGPGISPLRGGSRHRTFTNIRIDRVLQPCTISVSVQSPSTTRLGNMGKYLPLSGTLSWRKLWYSTFGPTQPADSGFYPYP
jgi:hypothetical protein